MGLKGNFWMTRSYRHLLNMISLKNRTRPVSVIQTISLNNSLQQNRAFTSYDPTGAFDMPLHVIRADEFRLSGQEETSQLSQ
jgi:hypothetical protein